MSYAFCSVTMPTRAVSLRAFVVALLMLSVPLSAASAWAQAPGDSGFVKVSPAQRELNEKAFELTAQGEYDKAIDMLNSSLAIQEINVTYLNLGRALTWAGRCEEATIAFSRVATAPAVADPSPEQVKAALAGYLEELKAHCPGTLRVNCSGPDIAVRINGHQPIACGTSAQLMPDTYTLVGDSKRGRVSVSVQVVGNTERLVELGIQPPAETEAKPARSLNTWGWGLSAGGGALLAAAGTVELLVLMPGFDDLQSAADHGDLDRADALRSSLASAQHVNLALYIGGAAVLATGATFLLVDALSDDNDDDVEAERGSDLALLPWFDPAGGGVAWSVTW